MPETPDRTESLFAAALALPMSSDRAALLDRECANDERLRARVEALLRAHDRAGHLLDRPVPGGIEPTVIGSPGEQPGIVIAGRYKLLEAVGEGGMGTVWVAEQSQPVRRKVALKLIKAGMDSKSVLARFEAERQALAIMDHPNIAKVLDGGLTETGRPYFVMEYVKGVAITEFCDARRLSVPERLHLFTQVCHAIQHAHQKGIIHRDLKPSNILVAPYDDKAVPKVIDFGLAKAMNQSLTEKTLHTAHEMVLGTPRYMSPEQAQLNNIDVDTRSDIYSLGVLLYELLTGTTPLEKQRLREAAWDEVRRIIREEEPPRPSKRLSSDQTLPSLAASRHSEPARLTKLICGDLDWIVMKALEKDRTRRYETANGFAADVQRYLSGEAVLAHPPTLWYRYRKFAERHRRAILAGYLFLAGILCFIVSLHSQVERARTAERKAESRQQEAEKQRWKADAARQGESRQAEEERQARLIAEARRIEAEDQKIRAESAEKLAEQQLVLIRSEKEKVEQEKRIARAVTDFLQYKLLGQADVRNQGDALLRAGGMASDATQNPTIRELLERASRELTPDKIDASFPEQPLVQAGILQTVGNTWRGVGKYDQAIGFLQRSLALYRQHCGPDHHATINCMGNLALTYQKMGMPRLAQPLYQETLRLCQETLPPNHPDTLATMNNLAGAHLEAQDFHLAIPLYEEVLKHQKAVRGPDDPETLNSMNNLAVAYKDAGKYSQALQLQEETLRLMKAKLGPEHVQTLICMCNLANSYSETGKPEAALTLHEETFRQMNAKLGPDHPLTLTSMSGLASAQGESGKRDLAVQLHQDVLKLRTATLGAEHPDTLDSMNLLATAYRDAGKLELALPLFEETLKLRKAVRGPNHADTLTSMGNLAAICWSMKQLDKSIPLFEEVLKLKEAKFGRQHPATLLNVANLGVNYLDAGRIEQALPLLEESSRGAKTIPSLRWVNRVLLDGYVRAGQRQQAILLANEMLAEARNQTPKDSPQLVGELSSIGRSLFEINAFAEAESLLRESLAIQETKLPDHWLGFNTRSLLGGVLLGQHQYAEAEPLLLVGYEGMMQREATIPPKGRIRLPEALDRVIQLYTDWDRAEPGKGYDVKATEWKTRLYPGSPSPLPADQKRSGDSGDKQP